MSVNKYTTASGLQTLANGSRIWVGTKEAYEQARQAGTMPTDVLVALTNDDEELAQEVIEDDPRAVTSGAVYDALSNSKSIKYVHVFGGTSVFDQSDQLVLKSNANPSLYAQFCGVLLLIDDWLYFSGCVGDYNLPSGSYLYASTCSLSSADSALSNLQWDPDWVDSLPTKYGEIHGCGYLMGGGPVDTLAPTKGTLNLTVMTAAPQVTKGSTQVYFCGKVKNINA